jgi:hypothetical protein
VITRQHPASKDARLPVPADRGPGGPPSSGWPGAPADSGAADAVNWGRIQQQQAGLIAAKAEWHRPDELAVERTDLIGLTIGDTPELNQSVNAVLPGTITTPAGTIHVGPTTTAELSASSDDAIVTPNIARNASTDRDIALLWSWQITPKRPIDELVLTAHVQVPLDGGGSLNTDIPLRIHVKRTFGYTVGQIFHSWATWSAIVTAAAAGVGWLVRRRRRDQSPGAHPESAQAPAHHGNEDTQPARAEDAKVPPESN